MTLTQASRENLQSLLKQTGSKENLKENQSIKSRQKSRKLISSQTQDPSMGNKLPLKSFGHKRISGEKDLAVVAKNPASYVTFRTFSSTSQVETSVEGSTEKEKGRHKIMTKVPQAEELREIQQKQLPFLIVKEFSGKYSTVRTDQSKK